MVSAVYGIQVYVLRIIVHSSILFLLLRYKHSYTSGSWLNGKIPENQNLDPDNESPGSLVLPPNYKKYDTPLPHIKPNDPPDDQINVHNYHWRNNSKYLLWEDPPCQYFHEHVSPGKNYGMRRRKNYASIWGCIHVGWRLYDYMARESPSPTCPKVVGSQCFEFRGRRGRCYAKVEYAPKMYKFVLYNYC